MVGVRMLEVRDRWIVGVCMKSVGVRMVSRDLGREFCGRWRMIDCMWVWMKVRRSDMIFVDVVMECVWMKRV